MSASETTSTAHQGKLSGYFEHFANTESSPSANPTGAKVMICVNKVANQFKMQCAWAGSIQKKTYVDGYSDADIWVETNSHVMTNLQRIEFADLVLKELIKSNGIQQIEGPNYKPKATSFYTQGCDFDIVFSKSEWTDEGSMISPNSQDFHCKLNRQRAVKVLKILSKLNPCTFPKISGMQLERLILSCSKAIDRDHSNHLEYLSGFLLFKECLKCFIKAENASSLVALVSSIIPPMNTTDVWKLSQSIFQRWNSNSAVILSRFEVLYLKPVESVSQEEFQKVFRLPPPPAMTAPAKSSNIEGMLSRVGDSRVPRVRQQSNHVKVQNQKKRKSGKSGNHCNTLKKPKSL